VLVVVVVGLKLQSRSTFVVLKPFIEVEQAEK
jgi:hypothetical protein